MSHFKKLVTKLTLLSLVAVMLPQTAFAGATSNLQAYLSDHQVDQTDVGYNIQFTSPTGIDASTDTITFTFTAGTLSGLTASDIDLKDDGADKTVAGTAGAGTWGFGVSGSTITLTAPTNATSGEIAGGSNIQLLIGPNMASGATNGITNGSSAGSESVGIGGTFGDTGNVAFALVTDSSFDVTATVLETITMTIPDTAIEFGTVASGAVTTDANSTIEIDTNASGGYALSYVATDLANAASDTIAVNSGSTMAAGTEEWGINIAANASSVGSNPTQVAGAGTPTAAAGYGTADNYKLVTGGNQSLASSTGTAQDDVYTLTAAIAVSDITEAGAYAGTINLVLGGNF